MAKVVGVKDNTEGVAITLEVEGLTVTVRPESGATSKYTRMGEDTCPTRRLGRLLVGLDRTFLRFMK
jgi:hypothetical protein